jgi:hypothetical protein
MCEGEGRLYTVWSQYREIRDGEAVEMERLEHVMGYSSNRARQYRSRPGEYGFIARCSCPAGDAITLSRGWPKWSPAIPSIRKVNVHE